MKLNELEKAMLLFIRNFIKENKYAPSQREIRDGVGSKNTEKVNHHMHFLRRKGYIGFIDSSPRALWVEEKGMKVE